MTATQEFDVATLNHTYILPAPAATPPPAARPEPPSRPADAATSEFTRAIEEYKRRHNRPFPTWSEVLEVLRGLGYTKRAGLVAATRHRVRIMRAGSEAGEIRALLARLGGVPLLPPQEGEFGFPTDAARARALDLVRADQGWTSIEPR